MRRVTSLTKHVISSCSASLTPPPSPLPPPHTRRHPFTQKWMEQMASENRGDRLLPDPLNTISLDLGHPLAIVPRPAPTTSGGRRRISFDEVELPPARNGKKAASTT